MAKKNLKTKSQVELDTKKDQLRATEKDLEKFDHDYAEDEKVCERFMQELRPELDQVRINRREREETWLEDARLWQCQESAKQNYVGRAKLFVPELHFQVENSTSKFLSGHFPDENYLDAEPTKDTDEEDARKIRAAVFHELHFKNHLPVLSESFQRQKILYGTSPLKQGWMNRTHRIYTRDKDGKPTASDVPLFRGVKLDLVDVFRWYIYPETATMMDYHFILEDALIHKDELERQGLLNLSKIKEIVDREKTGEDSEHQWVDSERLQAAGIVQSLDSRPGCAFIEEVWMEWDLKKGNKVPIKALIANKNTVIQLKRNPYWHQRDPYVVGRYKRPPSKSFYAMSLPDVIRSQQYQINDVANQTMDSVTYTLNPIALIDPALAGDVNSFKVHPGAKWLASPQGVDFKFFPDVSAVGYQGMQQIRAMISQFSDTSTGIAPQLQGKARSATQATIVQQEVTSDLQVPLRADEFEVYIPLCQKTHILLQQYQREKYQIKVQGADAGSWIHKNVNPADLVGSVDFQWRGTSVRQKTAVRGQQLISFFGAANQFNAQFPGEIDMPLLFSIVAKEAFDIKGIEKVVISLRKKYTVDAEIENDAIMLGQDVLTHEGDDDEEHKREHELLLKKDLTIEGKLSLQRHLERHRIQGEAKSQISKNQARLRALQKATPAAGAAPAGGPPQLTGPGGGQPGNPFQAQTPASDADVTRGIRGLEAQQ